MVTIEQCQVVVVFVADDLGFLGPGIPGPRDRALFAPPSPPTPESLILVHFGSVSARFGSVWLRFGSVSGPFWVHFGVLGGVSGWGRGERLL